MAAVILNGVSRDSAADAQDRLEGLLSSRTVEAGQLGDELFAVAGLLAANPSLRRALTEPSRPDEAKIGVLDRLLRGQVSDPALELLSGTVRARWEEAGDLTEAIDGLAVTALLYEAEKSDRLDAVEDELFRFARTVAADVRLRDAFAARTQGADRKRTLVHQLLDGKVTPETERLVTQAALYPRGMRTEQVLEQYLDAAAARRRQLVAEVVAAQPLTEGQRARLSVVLRRIYGRDIRINLDVHPEVIGGLRIEVNGELIDNTVLSKLDTARRRLAG